LVDLKKANVEIGKRFYILKTHNTRVREAWKETWKVWKTDEEMWVRFPGGEDGSGRG